MLSNSKVTVLDKQRFNQDLDTPVPKNKNFLERLCLFLKIFQHIGGFLFKVQRVDIDGNIELRLFTNIH